MDSVKTFHFKGYPVTLTYKNVKNINVSFNGKQISVSAPGDVSLQTVKRILKEKESRLFKKKPKELGEVDGVKILGQIKNTKSYKIKLTPKEDHILVSYGSDVHEWDIKSFLMEKEDWLKEQTSFINFVKDVKESDKKPKSVLYFGEKIPVIYSDSDDIKLKNGVFILPETLKKRELVKNLKSFLSIELACFISPCLRDYERRINEKSSGYIIKEYKSLWGECNRKTGKINFNSYLACTPKSFIESIVAHEVTHLACPGHQRDFYNKLYSICPDYKRLHYLNEDLRQFLRAGVFYFV